MNLLSQTWPYIEIMLSICLKLMLSIQDHIREM